MNSLAYFVHLRKPRKRDRRQVSLPEVSRFKNVKTPVPELVSSGDLGLTLQIPKWPVSFMKECFFSVWLNALKLPDLTEVHYH